MTDIDPEIRERALNGADQREEDDYEAARYQREIDEGLRVHCYMKYVADGSELISVIAQRLRTTADELVEIAKKGYEIEYPVDDGHFEMVAEELRSK